MSPEVTEKRIFTYWWFPLLFGIMFVLIGIWILGSPADSLETLTKIIGVIAVVSGTTQILFTSLNRQDIPKWQFQLAGGVIDLAIGVILIVDPTILLKIITIFVGIWLIVNSITLIMRATEARQAKREVWKWELILGVVLLLIAILFLWHPMVLGISIAIWTGMAFIILGLFRIILTFKLRTQKNH